MIKMKIDDTKTEDLIKIYKDLPQDAQDTILRMIIEDSSGHTPHNARKWILNSQYGEFGKKRMEITGSKYYHDHRAKIGKGVTVDEDLDVSLKNVKRLKEFYQWMLKINGHDVSLDQIEIEMIGPPFETIEELLHKYLKSIEEPSKISQDLTIEDLVQDLSKIQDLIDKFNEIKIGIRIIDKDGDVHMIGDLGNIEIGLTGGAFFIPVCINIEDLSKMTVKRDE